MNDLNDLIDWNERTIIHSAIIQPLICNQSLIDQTARSNQSNGDVEFSRYCNSCETYALLDDGADKTLCDERLLRALNADSRQVTFNISTVNSTGCVTHGQEVDLQVQHVNSTDRVDLHNVWTVKRLPISSRTAAVSADIKKLSYLKDIDVPSIATTDVMLLIGTDSPAAHIPLEVRSGNSDQPYAIRTRLGWAIRGPVQATNASGGISVNFQQSTDVLLKQQLERMTTVKLAHGSRFTIRSSRFKVHDSRFTVHDSQFTVHDSRFTVRSSRFTIHGSRFTVHDSRFTVHDSRFTVHDSQFTVHDLQFAVHDSRFTIRSSRFTVHDSQGGREGGEEGGREGGREREREREREGGRAVKIDR